MKIFHIHYLKKFNPLTLTISRYLTNKNLIKKNCKTGRKEVGIKEKGKQVDDSTAG